MGAKKQLTILIIEDERPIRKKIASSLGEFGNIVDVGSKEEALIKLQEQDFDLAIIDLNLNGKLDGFKLLEETKKKQIYSVILSSSENEEYYEKAMVELDAEAFYSKTDFIKSTSLIMKEYFLRQKHSNHLTFSERFITQDSFLQDSIRSLIKYQAQGSSILILGESGVGKTELAKVLHEEGGFLGEFVSVNANAISKDLIESTLFGHKKGSFTGATTDKKGLLARANGGTLFIDEIAMIPESVQIKLLTCLDEKRFTPIGGEEDPPIYSNFALVSATCDDIAKKLSEKEFRYDLYNRIAGEIITIPPLRKRPNDIPLLIKHFLKQSPKKKVIKADALEFLKSRRWPSNIRGLIRIVNYCLSLKEGVITREILETKLLSIEETNNQISNEETSKANEKSRIDYDFIQTYGFKKYIKKIKSEIIQTIHEERFHGNLKQTSEFLQLSRANLFLHLRRK